MNEQTHTCTPAHLGQTHLAKSYLRSVEILFEANRTIKYPYIIDFGVESGPLSHLMGHMTELTYKALLAIEGIPEKRLRNFKGFQYKDGHRYAKTQFRRHNINFLYRAVSMICLAVEDRAALNRILASHTFQKETAEIFLEQPERPNLDDYKTAIANLNASFDSPFSARYFLQNQRRLPDPELIMIVTRFLLKKAESEYRKSILSGSQ